MRNDAQNRQEKANIGVRFGIAMEKNHELPMADPRCKYEGRAVFQGSNV
jgi:hypothetical protein